MTLGISLDAAYPAAPEALRGDIRQVGAQIVMPYVYGPFMNWTAAHEDVARQEGCQIMGILVPGNQPPPVDQVMTVVRQLLTSTSPLLIDLERYSLPPEEWVAECITVCHAAGELVGGYGSRTILDSYAGAGFDFQCEALWIRTGSILPAPAALPAGDRGQQYVNDCRLQSGSSYDGSILDLSLFEENDMTPDEAAQMDRIDRRTAAIYNLLASDDTGAEDASGEHKPLAIVAQLTAIQTAVTSLQAPPPVDTAALAAALVPPLTAALKAALPPGGPDAATVATATLAELSRRLSLTT